MDKEVAQMLVDYGRLQSEISALCLLSAKPDAVILRSNEPGINFIVENIRKLHEKAKASEK